MDCKYFNKKPVLGVVYNPIYNEFYWGIDGKGSYMNDNPKNSEMDSFAKGCLIAVAILIGVPLLFIKCLLAF